MNVLDFIKSEDVQDYEKFIKEITKQGEKNGGCVVFDGNGFRIIGKEIINNITIGDYVLPKQECLSFFQKIKNLLFHHKDKIKALCFLEGFYEIYEGEEQVIIYFENKKTNKFFIAGINYLEKV